MEMIFKAYAVLIGCQPLCHFEARLGPAAEITSEIPNSICKTHMAVVSAFQLWE